MILASFLQTSQAACKSAIPRSPLNTIRILSMSTTPKKGKVLILGGNGYVGSNVANRAISKGYEVTSLSRRGVGESKEVDYRKGDARDQSVLVNILSEGDYIAVVHCIGLLFDSASGLGKYNRLASGSGAIPDENSTYDEVTRVTAFNAIQASEDYAASSKKRIPFIFTSAAEANWPNVSGGSFVENKLAPDWLKRYLEAKRAVEQRLLEKTSSTSHLRSIIFRPGLIYSMDKVVLFPSVLACTVGNTIGLKFMSRPVNVHNLATAMVKAIEDESVEGVQEYSDICDLASSS